MKAYVYCDERYPDYGIDADSTGLVKDTIDITEEKFAKYKAAEDAYAEYQNELRDLLKIQQEQQNEHR